MKLLTTCELTGGEASRGREDHTQWPPFLREAKERSLAFTGAEAQGGGDGLKEPLRRAGCGVNRDVCVYPTVYIVLSIMTC